MNTAVKFVLYPVSATFLIYTYYKMKFKKDYKNSVILEENDKNQS